MTILRSPTAWTRATYVALALGTIALGLVVHRWGAVLGPRLHDATGDAFWAAMIVWWIGAIAPNASLRVRGATALVICIAVEVSQLYHTPWLDALRETTVGHLVLGSSFDARDLVAYAVGVLAAVLFERARVVGIASS